VSLTDVDEGGFPATLLHPAAVDALAADIVADEGSADLLRALMETGTFPAAVGASLGAATMLYEARQPHSR
jgi:hypothetical protein